MDNRFEELDGLRGIAAFMVFLSHAIGLLAVTEFVGYYQNSPARIISDGAAAVDIFFVLSGFVLSLPFIDKNKDINYVTFVFKRIFRLYPAYWVCIATTVILKEEFNPDIMLSLSEWSQTLWTKPVTESDLIKHIPLIIKTDSQVINPIIWTLAVEMKMSLILPIFIFWLKNWRGGASQILLILTVTALSCFSAKFAFLPLFIMGLILSKYWRRFYIISEVNFKTVLFLTVVLVLIGNRFILNVGGDAHFQSLAAGFGAVLLIPIAIFFRPIKNLFTHPIVAFMGKVSYSFYLYHLPLLLITISILYPFFKGVLFPAIISFILTIMISLVSYHSIEYKSMVLYKNLEAKFLRR